MFLLQSLLFKWCLDHFLNNKDWNQVVLESYLKRLLFSLGSSAVVVYKRTLPLPKEGRYVYVTWKSLIWAWLHRVISHDTSSIFGDAFEWRASFDCILKADGWATFCRCLTRKSGPLKLCLHKIRLFQSPLTAFYDQCLKLGILVLTILLVFKFAIKKNLPSAH